jgi:hypothetical protein
MNNRERVHAILHYEPYDKMPVVHFGYWRETLEKWAHEGHISIEQAEAWADGNPTDAVIAKKLGFDINWNSCFSPDTRLRPPFKTEIIETFPDGSRHVMNDEGTIILEKDDAVSIPKEIKHLLTDRSSWESLYLPKLQFEVERITRAAVNVNGHMVPFDQGGADYLKKGEWDDPYGLHAGSLFGVVRNWLGIVGLSYLMADDPGLLLEIIDTVADLCYECTKTTLEMVGAHFDFAHFWEDISFKSGSLISPRYFSKHVGPHYRRITELVNSYGIDIVSLDSDGKIDQLIPTWFGNGVNTMFPIEVGTWGSNIAPWREQFGQSLRGVGGMNKVVFSRDYQAIDAEIQRMQVLVELGGYIPCPDHRLAPDAKWENVQYYCEKMHQIFG